MPDLLAVLLALALGLVIGFSAGARRTLMLIRQGRRIRGANAAIARFLPSEMPARSSADILAGRIRILLGGVTYDLPVLARGPSRRWLESLDARFASLATDLEHAGDNAGAIMARLLSETDALRDMLVAYDETGVIPPLSELDEQVSDAEILRSVLEVWRAANPLAAIATDDEPDATSGPSPVRPSSPRPPSGGALTTSTPG
jgi:hypothetical protein